VLPTKVLLDQAADESKLILWGRAVQTQKSPSVRKNVGLIPVFHLCKLLLQALNFISLQWWMKVRSSINVKIYWVQAGGDDLHTSLLTIQPGFISGGAGEDEW